MMVFIHTRMDNSDLFGEKARLFGGEAPTLLPHPPVNETLSKHIKSLGQYMHSFSLNEGNRASSGTSLLPLWMSEMGVVSGTVQLSNELIKGQMLM